MKNFEGYLKKKFGDNYVLLAGGSHKSLSDFAMANAYLPLSGGTITGPIYFGQPSTNTTILAYNSDYPKFGIWYNEGEYDTMKLSASGNADTDAGADLCINGNGDGTVTIRGNIILHAGNYNTWAAAKSHTHDYLPLSGGTMTDSITFSQTSSNRKAGIIGSYDPNRAAAIWTMGSSYQIKADGTTFGSLYGAAYAYFGSGYTFGAGYSNGHSLVWCQNGTIYAALGNSIWSKGGFVKSGSSDSYLLLGGGGHKAVSDFSASGHGHNAATLVYGEGDSDVTDGTELLTSYASNNGFSDTNAPNLIYKRSCSKVYNYIKGKLDSIYQAKTSLITSIINSLNEGTGDFTDDTEIVTSNNGAVFSSDPTLFKRKASKMYNYLYPKFNQLYLKISGITTHVYLTGASANSSTSNTSQIVFGTSSNNHVALSSNTNALIINPSTTNTTGQTVIRCGGDSTFGGNVYVSSDRRLKMNIQSIPELSLERLFDVSDKLLKKFTWKQSGKNSYGFIAQQLEKWIPEAVTSNSQGIKSVSYNVAYAKIIAALVYKTKEQQKEINDLKDQLSKVVNIIGKEAI